VLCGYARDSVITATTTAGDAGLSGTVTDSYVSVLEAPALTPECAAAMTPHSAGKLRRPSAPFFWVTAGGGFCTITGQGIEPLTIVGRTGAYEGAGA
jgi:hypothetical protein